MIRVPLKPFVRVELLRTYLLVGLTGWAATASVWAYRNRPEVVLVGLDEAGTRVITSAADPIVAKERVKFVREFLRSFYNYSAQDYAQTMSQAGALMSDQLWKEKEVEFRRIDQQLKEKPLSQEARLLDLREVSQDEFEADIGIRLRSRLQERDTKFRVVLKIAPRKRSVENPYPLEVTSIYETETQ